MICCVYILVNSACYNLRTILLVRLAAAMGLNYLLEQPCHEATGGLQSIMRFQELTSDLTDASAAIRNCLYSERLV